MLKFLRLLLLIALITVVAVGSALGTVAGFEPDNIGAKISKRLDLANKKNEGICTNRNCNDTKIDKQFDHWEKIIGKLSAKNASKSKKSSGIRAKEIVTIVVIGVLIGLVYNYFKKIKQRNAHSNSEEQEDSGEQKDSSSEVQKKEWWVELIRSIVVTILCFALYKVIAKSCNCFKECSLACCFS